MEINKIKVGKRFRKDIGELETLKNSIKELGLLQPIVIDEKGNLIAGLRRLKACKELGKDDIKVNVVKIENALKGEYDENVIRKSFAPSESVAIWEAMEKRTANQFTPRSESDRSKPRERASKLLKTSTDTLSKAKQVVESKNKELIEKMDRTGNVDRAYQEVKRQKHQKKLLEKISKMPTGKYRVLMADCPWSYGNSGLDEYGHAERHYPTMSIQELCDMSIKEICEDNAVLFLWVTSPMLEDAFRVISAWGFTYKTSFVWNKLKHNFGYYNSVRHEFLLIATKGSCLPDNKKLYNSVVSIERTKHSEKPECFREMIDKLYTHGKKIELFARKKVKNWSSFGNEIK